MTNVKAGPWDKGPFVESGGEPPQDGGMDSRLSKLEAIIPTLATKSDVEGVRTDLHKMDASITRWMIATVIALFLGFAGLFFTMSNTINGALERATRSGTVSAPAPAPPIIIQMPPAPQPQPQPQHATSTEKLSPPAKP